MELSFLVLLLLITTPVVVSQQDFLSIDCGVEANFSGNTDKSTGIVYVSDEPYTDAGDNRRIAPDREGRLEPRFQTLRSFPSGERNCYALPTVAGTKYLARAEFAYGNYDGKNSSSLEFDLHLGPNRWETFQLGPGEASSSDYYRREAIFVAWAGWAPLCFVNTGGGTPFVNVVELRPLGAGLYPQVAPGLIISRYWRQDMGANVPTWYPADPYGRYWWNGYAAGNPRWVDELTTQPIAPDDIFAVPSIVLQTAVAAAGNATALTATTWQDDTAKLRFMVLLHFADFQNTQFRQFDIYLDENRLVPVRKSYSPSYLRSSSVSVESYRATDGKYSITLVPTNTSVLPPIINGLEIYVRVPYENPVTLPQDFDAIMAIKIEYGVKKNWMGDPCFPSKYAWDGVKCSNASGNTSRITSLDLSNSYLRGPISKNFTLLTALENLDLSYNNLSGSIPDSLPSLPSLRVLNVSGNLLSSDSTCKNYTGSLIFRYDHHGSKCNTSSRSPPRNKAAIVAISVVVPVLVVLLVLVAYFVWREKRKANVQPLSTHWSTRDPQPHNHAGVIQSHGDNLKKTENRRFTYKELAKFTNNFKKFIGRGGFGSVYYGHLEDNTEVAVKMRSESSSCGLDEFLAEVQSLTKVHHRNLVTLIGYCWEKDHLALVYEHMSQGSLFDHLRGTTSLEG
ncbi:hypothetical protein SORBI_3002G178101 [Sorghum bicolor]|uniref:non-specific serine/threonine protein kinase n=1 Tax=Sorghum bicolor TaxID=4558 RepID=A0A1W0W4L5_SORBI|nr:hypothetical protein SORBI_3002G178101 [Sorghum bicolor]